MPFSILGFAGIRRQRSKPQPVQRGLASGLSAFCTESGESELVVQFLG